MKTLTGILRFIGTLVYVWIIITIVGGVVTLTLFLLGEAIKWSPIGMSMTLTLAGCLLLGIIWCLLKVLPIPLVWLTKGYKNLGKMAFVIIVLYCISCLFEVWFGDQYSTIKIAFKIFVSLAIGVYIPIAIKIYRQSK